MTLQMPDAVGGSAARAAAMVVAALAGGLEAVPFIVAAGLIAFAPLGEAMAGIGIAAAFLGAIIVSALLGVAAHRRGLFGGPSIGLALMISGALATLTQQGVLAAGDTGAAMAVAALLTLGCGVLMAGIAALGIGRIAPLVPYPVLAGLRNGIAILLLLEQTHAAMGMPVHGHGSMHPGALIVTAVTAVPMLWRVPGLQVVPAIVLAMAAGTAVHHGLALLPWGEWLVGPAMPHVPSGFGQLSGGLFALPSLSAAVVREVLLPTLLSMTVLGLLETVACASALQSETGQRSSGRRDLLAVALANIAGGVAGALPSAGSVEETVLNAHAPAARPRVAALLRCGLLLAVALLAMPLLTRVPNAVFAGVIIVTALHVADLSSLRQMVADLRAGRRHRFEGGGSLLVVVSVAALAATLGLVAAVFVGMMLSLVVFVADMARGPVRRRYVSPLGRSRARRGDRETETLLRDGVAIEVIELQGALFFGSADQVVGEIEAAQAGGAAYIVLDLRRLHRMDLSGARVLVATCERLWQSGRWLVLAGMRPGLPAWEYLSDHGLGGRLPAGRAFGTLEDAIESAEARLLGDRLGSVADPVLSGSQALMSLGIPETAVAVLLRTMTEVSFAAGAAIVSAGDTSRDLFVLLEGRVTVALRVHAVGGESEHTTRIATLAPGTLFGEMALLARAPRSADLVANGAVRCLRLSPEALETLRAEDPDSAWHLLTAIALQIDLNLRLANAAIASYEE